MPVIDKPKDRPPLFGGGVQIVIGGPLVHLLREQRKKQAKSAASTKNEED